MHPVQEELSPPHSPQSSVIAPPAHSPRQSCTTSSPFDKKIIPPSTAYSIAKAKLEK